MSTGLLLIMFLVGLVAFLVLLGRLYPGSGNDLLDWDPARAARERAYLDTEDLEQLRVLAGDRGRGAAAADPVVDCPAADGPGAGREGDPR